MRCAIEPAPKPFARLTKAQKIDGTAVFVARDVAAERTSNADAMSNTAAFSAVVEAIVARPEHRHARFGLAVHDLANGATLFEYDAQSYFAGASTTKIPTTAAALAALGADFRFRTVVRHTGLIDADGVLHGDLVLVACGDPNLSARVGSDDTLAFADVDHVLSGMPGARSVPGDPLAILRKLAAAVASSGLKRITGEVLIDLTLFAEGYCEPGTFVVVSPIVINDNVIDVTVRAGERPGTPLEVAFNPVTRYAEFVCDAVAGEPGSRPALTISGETREPSSARRVRISGSLPAGTHQLYVHPVASPSAFARTLFVELLAQFNLSVANGHAGPAQYLGGAAAFAPRVLAEHVSPPFAQAVRVINKVSQNLHAELCPRVVGATVEHARGAAAEAAGYAYLKRFLAAIDVDTDGMLQGDACGMYGYYTPDFMCRLLRAIDAHADAGVFRASLPVLGRDGTLHDIAAASSAAGHVFAKTGTLGFEDRLQPRTIVQAKGLAGYIEAASGRSLAFAAYANNVALEAGQTWSQVGNVLGEIAVAAFANL